MCVVILDLHDQTYARDIDDAYIYGYVYIHDMNTFRYSTYMYQYHPYPLEGNLYLGGGRRLLYRFVESCKSNVNGDPLSSIKSLKQRRITIKIKVREHKGCHGSLGSVMLLMGFYSRLQW